MQCVVLLLLQCIVLLMITIAYIINIARFKLVDEFCETGDDEVVRKRQVKARLLYFQAGQLTLP